MRAGPASGGRPRGDAGLVEDGVEMVFHGAGGDEEPLPDLRVRESLRDEAQDLDLARGEAGGIGRGRCLRGVEAPGEGVGAGEGRLCPQRHERCLRLIEQGASRDGTVRDGVEFREGEERQRPLIRGGAGIREGKGLVQVLPGVRVATRFVSSSPSRRWAARSASG